MGIIDNTALVLVIVGALNWGSIGLFNYDIVAAIFGGSGSLLARVVYTLVAIAGLWTISLLFKDKMFPKYDQ